jgi:hypothetical protein
MTVWQKVLIGFAVPLQVIITLIGIGLISHSTTPIAIAGFLVLFSCFVLFAGADTLLRTLKSYRSNPKFNRFSRALDARTLAIIDFLASLPTGATLLIRAFFLSASFWIVDLFVALCAGGLPAFADQIRKNLAMTMVSLMVSVLDATRGKTVQHPGWLSKLLATFGSVQFYRGFYLLGAAMLGRAAFEAVQYLFSNPFWFLSIEERYHLAYLWRFSDYTPQIMLFGLVPLLALFPTVILLPEQERKEDKDLKYMGWGLVITFLWLVSLPIYEVGLFIYFFVTKP